LPTVKTLKDRVDKFTAKMDPATAGARFAASKTIAVKRYINATAAITDVVELTRNVLESKGVPAGQHAVYYAFEEMVRRAAFSHDGATLKAIVDGLKQQFVYKGADPAVLDAISKLVVGG
jgi:hypothetical protein